MKFMATVFDETVETEAVGIILPIHGSGIIRLKEAKFEFHATGDGFGTRDIHSQVLSFNLYTHYIMPFPGCQYQ